MHSYLPPITANLFLLCWQARSLFFLNWNINWVLVCLLFKCISVVQWCVIDPEGLVKYLLHHTCTVFIEPSSIIDWLTFFFFFFCLWQSTFTLQILLPVMFKACFSLNGVTGKSKLNFILEFKFINHLSQLMTGKVYCL